MDTLEHAQNRTEAFIKFVEEKILSLGLKVEESEFLFLSVAKKAQGALTEVTEHYELREKVATSYTSAAYKYLMTEWGKVIEP